VDKEWIQQAVEKVSNGWLTRHKETTKPIDIGILYETLYVLTHAKAIDGDSLVQCTAASSHLGSVGLCSNARLSMNIKCGGAV
jgi:hypothetical protein